MKSVELNLIRSSVPTVQQFNCFNTINVGCMQNCLKLPNLLQKNHSSLGLFDKHIPFITRSWVIDNIKTTETKYKQWKLPVVRY